MRSKPLRTADYLRHIAEAIDNIVEFGVWNSVEFGVGGIRGQIPIDLTVIQAGRG